MTDVIFFPVRDEFASTLSECVPLGQLIDPSVYETLNTAQDKETECKSIDIASKKLRGLWIYWRFTITLSSYIEYERFFYIHHVFQSK